MELTDLKAWLDEFNYKDIIHSERETVAQTIKSILVKINSLIDLNVGYLSLSRNIPSLSCGEKQRVRIANQINCFLRGVIYILDEPCKGLHYIDISNIIKATRNLVENDGSVIAIEHNKQYISAADNTIELGPSEAQKADILYLGLKDICRL